MKKKMREFLCLRFLYPSGTFAANPRQPAEELVSGMERPFANLCSFQKPGAGLVFCCVLQASLSWNSSCLLHCQGVSLLLSCFGLQASFCSTLPRSQAGNGSRLDLWDWCSNTRCGAGLSDLINSPGASVMRLLACWACWALLPGTGH